MMRYIVLFAALAYGCAALPGHESREAQARKVADKYCASDAQKRSVIRAKVNKILAGEVRIDCPADGAVLTYVRKF